MQGFFLLKKNFQKVMAFMILFVMGNMLYYMSCILFWQKGVFGYEVYVGTIGSDGPDWQLVATGTWEDNGDWKVVRFPTVEDALFVKLIGVSTYGVKPDTWMSAAEIEFVTTYPKLW